MARLFKGLLGSNCQTCGNKLDKHSGTLLHCPAQLQCPPNTNDFLDNIERYLEAHQDVNYEGTGPNEAMQLLQQLNEVKKEFLWPQG